MYKDADLRAQCETGTEINLYKIIEFLGGCLFWLRHDGHRLPGGGDVFARTLADAREREAALQAQIEQAVDATQRFGVVQPRQIAASDGRAGGPTDDYWRWYTWWDRWWTGLTDEEKDHITRLALEGQDLSAYRPAGHWRLLPAGRV